MRQSLSLDQNLRDRDETLTSRDRDLEQKVETRPRLERAETRHETFGIRGSQKGREYFNRKYIPMNFFIRQNVASDNNCLIETKKNCHCTTRRRMKNVRFIFTGDTR